MTKAKQFYDAGKEVRLASITKSPRVVEHTPPSPPPDVPPIAAAPRVTRYRRDTLWERGDEEIRHHLPGTLCRYDANPEIIEAAKFAAKRRIVD